MSQAAQQKNRNKGAYSFANINFLGRCNCDCYFCLGKDLEEEFARYNHLSTPVSALRNFERFLELCRQKGIENIYVTGQNTDSLLYRHLDDLIDTLQDGWGFKVGLRTNGLLAERKIDTINKCRKSISYTLLTLKPEVMRRITCVSRIPNFDYIFRSVKIPQRLATVVTPHNADEVLDLIQYASRYPQIRYFQVRRISTDTRLEELKEDIAAFDALEARIKTRFPKIREFELAPVYDIFGVETTFWKTIETSANSLNYFSNGVVSDEYFIIEGYLKNKSQLEVQK